MENQAPAFSAAEPSVRSAAGKSAEENSAGSVEGSPSPYQSSGVPRDIGAAGSPPYLRNASRGSQPPNSSRRMRYIIVMDVAVFVIIGFIEFSPWGRESMYWLGPENLAETAGLISMNAEYYWLGIMEVATVAVVTVLTAYSIYQDIKHRRTESIDMSPWMVEDVGPAVNDYSDKTKLEMYTRMARVLEKHPDEVNAVLGHDRDLDRLDVAQRMYERAEFESRSCGENMNPQSPANAPDRSSNYRVGSSKAPTDSPKVTGSSSNDPGRLLSIPRQFLQRRWRLLQRPSAAPPTHDTELHDLPSGGQQVRSSGSAASASTIYSEDSPDCQGCRSYNCRRCGKSRQLQLIELYKEWKEPVLRVVRRIGALVSAERRRLLGIKGAEQFKKHGRS